MTENNRKRKPITPQERAHQEALKKIKRLNLKLSEIHKLNTHISSIAKKGEGATNKQLIAWTKRIQAIINKQDPKED